MAKVPQSHRTKIAYLDIPYVNRKLSHTSRCWTHHQIVFQQPLPSVFHTWSSYRSSAPWRPPACRGSFRPVFKFICGWGVAVNRGLIWLDRISKMISLISVWLIWCSLSFWQRIDRQSEKGNEGKRRVMFVDNAPGSTLSKLVSGRVCFAVIHHMEACGKSNEVRSFS